MEQKVEKTAEQNGKKNAGQKAKPKQTVRTRYSMIVNKQTRMIVTVIGTVIAVSMACEILGVFAFEPMSLVNWTNLSLNYKVNYFLNLLALMVQMMSGVLAISGAQQEAPAHLYLASCVIFIMCLSSTIALILYFTVEEDNKEDNKMLVLLARVGDIIVNSGFSVYIFWLAHEMRRSSRKESRRGGSSHGSVGSVDKLDSKENRSTK